MPKERVDAWYAEREEWLRKHPEPWDAKTEEEYYQLFPDRWEKWLDESHGECVLARPELLLPSEQWLASLALADVDERLVLLAESRRLQQEAVTRDKEHAATLARRAQADADEIARLRRQLEEAQKKLEAVTRVEQSVTGLKNPPPP